MNSIRLIAHSSIVGLARSSTFRKLISFYNIEYMAESTDNAGDNSGKTTQLKRYLIDCFQMPYLVREHLFIGNIGDAAEVLQNGSDDITHILLVLSSESISFFSERRGLSIPSKEIRKVYVGDSGSEDGSDNGTKTVGKRDLFWFAALLVYLRAAGPIISS